MPPREIFVFGSNREGRHGAGAARYAMRSCGAVYGQPEGLQGSSYAIVTKELRPSHPPVTVSEIASGIERFIAYARDHPSLTFNLSPIGCGLAGFTPATIAPLFVDAPPNVIMPDCFRGI